jgi:hypothetical protein
VNPGDERIIELIVRRHGAMIDVRRRPEVMLDVLRRVGPVVTGAPATPAQRLRRRAGRLVRAARSRAAAVLGHGPAPAPAPVQATSPARPPVEPGTAEILREVLALSRSVEHLRRQMGGQVGGATGPSTPMG